MLAPVFITEAPDGNFVLADAATPVVRIAPHRTKNDEKLSGGQRGAKCKANTGDIFLG
jgi:hypothetical protein